MTEWGGCNATHRSENANVLRILKLGAKKEGWFCHIFIMVCWKGEKCTEASWHVLLVVVEKNFEEREVSCPFWPNGN